MAKIEIVGSPEELDRISTFLNINNFKFKIVDDYKNHSKEESERYRVLKQKFK